MKAFILRKEKDQSAMNILSEDNRELLAKIFVKIMSQSYSPKGNEERIKSYYLQILSKNKKNDQFDEIFETLREFRNKLNIIMVGSLTENWESLEVDGLTLDDFLSSLKIKELLKIGPFLK